MKKLKYAGLYFAGIILLIIIWYTAKFSPILESGQKIAQILLTVTIALIFLLFVIQSFLTVRLKEGRAEIWFAVSMMIWGIIYMLLLPPFSAPDETTHFANAYKLANGMLNQEATDVNGKVYVRAQDYQNYVKHPTEESITDFYKGIGKKAPEDAANMVLDYEGGEGVRAFFLNHLPQAVGIAAARIFDFDFTLLTLCGRFLNLLTFTIMGYWAIKWIPFGKWPFFIVSQFPMMLELAGSYSYDVLAAGLAFMFIAWCMRLIYEKEIIRKRDLLVLLVLGLVMSPVKAVYGFIVLLVFLLPGNKMPGKVTFYHFLYKAGLVFLCLSAVIAVNTASFLRTIDYTVREVPVEEKVLYQDQTESLPKDIPEQRYYSIQTIIDNPVLLVDLSVNTIKERGWSYISTLVGRYLGWMEIAIHPVIIFFFLFLFLAALLFGNGKKYHVTGVQRILAGIILLACFLVFHYIMLVSWTEPGASFINGVQGRYFIPLVPLLFILCYKEKVNLRINIPIIFWAFASNLLNLLTILQAMSKIYAR